MKTEAIKKTIGFSLAVGFLFVSVGLNCPRYMDHPINYGGGPVAHYGKYVGTGRGKIGKTQTATTRRLKLGDLAKKVSTKKTFAQMAKSHPFKLTKGSTVYPQTKWEGFYPDEYYPFDTPTQTPHKTQKLDTKKYLPSQRINH
jgi:hypothetical protein